MANIHKANDDDGNNGMVKEEILCHISGKFSVLVSENNERIMRVDLQSECEENGNIKKQEPFVVVVAFEDDENNRNCKK